MTLVDQVERELAIRERARNVIVDASAGTGKTKLVVDRLVELVAPSDSTAPIEIGRIAAITFTRKAAGELRVRTRQRILETLAQLPVDSPRIGALHRALAGIDTAPITTIHAFADRLLRKWPAQTRLDPHYQLVENNTFLVEECFDVLLQAAESSTLHELVDGGAEEAVATLHAAARAGVPLRSRSNEHHTYHGLEGLFAGFILHRDVDTLEPDALEFDRATFDCFAEELVGLTASVSPASPGGAWLAAVGEHLRSLRTELDPAIVYDELVAWLDAGPRRRASESPRKGIDFGGDDHAWNVWKAFDGDSRRKRLRDGSLRDDLLAPLRRWLSVRLVRLRRVVLELYERTKGRYQAVDHVDLLLRLRDLLRDDRGVREAAQGLFDHIFVDEFQDTDPLQAEIVLFLCERGAVALVWDAVVLRAGALTLVGDPKQSIYRFRRADLGTYQRVIEIVERSPHLSVRLTSSFRTAPALVGWLNDRFDDLLGRSHDGERFRAETGEVCHHPLTIGRSSGNKTTVHAVAIALPEQVDAVACRAREAEAMARYVRWLVQISAIEILDPLTERSRPIGFGDIGVLAIATTNLPVLFEAFDRNSVPYAARGGRLFLGDPLHRRFLLGLCALADRDDGVAAAALLRPPFFAIDLSDLARSTDRANVARAIVTELRRRRFERSPGETARALVEQTGLGRHVAIGPNGAQRLSAIGELCLQVEAKAHDERLDFDAVVERVRAWIDHPPVLDRPHPVGGESVRAMTIHQAKGLEFPVVVLWDARADWTEQTSYEPWSVERNGRGWALRLDHVRWEMPEGLQLADRERAMKQAERKRLVYVAATRARDLLVIPELGPRDERRILGRLLGPSDTPAVLVHPPHSSQAPAAWFTAACPPIATHATRTTSRDRELNERWVVAARDASRERLAPIAFTDASNPRALWGKQGRFGTVFGETVHVAIGLAMRTGKTAADAVRVVAARAGLASYLDEAASDVERALMTLAGLGICRFALEYPVSGVAGDKLVSGYIDLLAVVLGRTLILDFKTDAPPQDDLAIPQRYVEQVCGYANVVRGALATPVSVGLLYTADGRIRWLSPRDNGGS